MSPEERDRIMHEYSQYRSENREELGVLCEGTGIREYNWNYSDFAGAARFDEKSGPLSIMALRHLD